MTNQKDGASEAGGALAGYRVLEVARVPPAELPGMMMADLGADVLKIESPAGSNPHGLSGARDAAASPTNRNKRSIVLNLKSDEAKGVFRELVRTADVLVEGYRPGVMSRLGLGYEELRGINPRLIYCAMSGFGQDGPYRMRPAHDMNFMALTGALDLLGEPGGQPMVPSNMVADLGAAAMHAFGGVLAALLARERTGAGQLVDISYLDTTMALVGASMGMRHFFGRGQYTPKGAGIAGLSYPYYKCYLTKDDRYLAVACSEMPLWVNFCKAIGRPDLASVTRAEDIYQRVANEAERRAAEQVATVIRSRNSSEWEEIFAQTDVCCSIVKSVEEAMEDPQLRHRGMIGFTEHPAFGSIGHIAPPIRLSATPAKVRTCGPMPGEHTLPVLRDLGYGEGDIDRMLASAAAEAAR